MLLIGKGSIHQVGKRYIRPTVRRPQHGVDTFRDTVALFDQCCDRVNCRE